MAVTVNPLVRTGRHTVSVSWTSDAEDPVYYVYRDGQLVAVTRATQMTLTLAAGEAVTLQVLDDADGQPDRAYPCRLDVQWRTVSGAVHYRLEEYVDSAWLLRATVRESGQGYYHWLSRPLEDVTTHQFRVRAVGADGNVGTATALSCLMVRLPDPPDVDYAYSDSTHKLSVSAS